MVLCQRRCAQRVVDLGAGAGGAAGFMLDAWARWLLTPSLRYLRMPHREGLTSATQRQAAMAPTHNPQQGAPRAALLLLLPCRRAAIKARKSMNVEATVKAVTSWVDINSRDRKVGGIGGLGLGRLRRRCTRRFWKRCTTPRAAPLMCCCCSGAHRSRLTDRLLYLYAAVRSLFLCSCRPPGCVRDGHLHGAAQGACHALPHQRGKAAQLGGWPHPRGVAGQGGAGGAAGQCLCAAAGPRTVECASARCCCFRFVCSTPF